MSDGYCLNVFIIIFILFILIIMLKNDHAQLVLSDYPQHVRTNDASSDAVAVHKGLSNMRAVFSRTIVFFPISTLSGRGLGSLRRVTAQDVCKKRIARLWSRDSDALSRANRNCKGSCAQETGVRTRKTRPSPVKAVAERPLAEARKLIMQALGKDGRRKRYQEAM